MVWLRRVFFVGLAAWLVFLFFASDLDQKSYGFVAQKFISFTGQRGFVVKDVLVTGRERTNADELKSILDKLKGQALLSVDFEALSDEIEALQWVRTASVQRLWPERLRVEIIERTPYVFLADIRSEDALVLLDEALRPIGRFEPESFPNIMRVKGQSAAQAFGAFQPVLNAHPMLVSRLDYAEYIGERRWDLVFQNGLRVHLSEKDFALSLSRLERAHHEHNILEQPLNTIDLRPSDRMILEKKDVE
jgi:cell division protein FtsQ